MDPVSYKIGLLRRRIRGPSETIRLLQLQYPLFVPCIGFIIGLAIQHFYRFPVSLSLVVCISVFGLWGISLKLKPDMAFHPYLLVGIVFISFTCTGMVRMYFSHRTVPNDLQNIATQDSQLARLEGIVLTQPRQSTPDEWVFSRSWWADPPTLFLLDVQTISTNQGFQPAVGKIQVKVSDVLEGVSIGDRMRVYAWLNRFEPVKNPGQFDYQRYMNRNGIYFQAACKKAQSIETIEKSSKLFWPRTRAALQNSAYSSLAVSEIDPPDQSGILDALLLGRRGRLSSEAYRAFRRTGLLHLISLSGLHIGIFVFTFWRLGRLAGLPKRIRAILCIAVTLLFLVVIPARAPSLRAGFLALFFCVSILIRRNPEPINTLCLSAIVLLAILPTDFLRIGWQLSYACVFGILILYPSIQQKIKTGFYRFISWISIYIKSRYLSIPVKILTPALDLLAVGIAAWIASSGILLYHFGSLALFSGIWTVLVFPLVWVLLILGMLKILIATVLPTTAAVLGIVLSALSSAFESLVQWLASFPLNEIVLGPLSILFVLFLFGIILLIRFNNLYGYRKRLACIYLLPAVIFFWPVAQKIINSSTRPLELMVLSVGRGQVICLHTPDNRHFLFDAGSASIANAGEKVLHPYLHSKGVKQLNAAFISHDDMDHINAVPEVCKLHRIQHLYAGGQFIDESEKSFTARLLLDAASNLDLSIELWPQTVQTESGVIIEKIWPNSRSEIDTRFQDNNASGVFLITYSGRSILLCGDIERPAQEELLRLYPDLHPDVVLMPHHGTNRNLLHRFYERLSPRICIASCSHRQIETTVMKNTAETCLYTASDGAVSIRIDKTGRLKSSSYVQNAGE